MLKSANEEGYANPIHSNIKVKNILHPVKRFHHINPQPSNRQTNTS